MGENMWYYGTYMELLLKLREICDQPGLPIPVANGELLVKCKDE